MSPEMGRRLDFEHGGLLSLSSLLEIGTYAYHRRLFYGIFHLLMHLRRHGEPANRIALYRYAPESSSAQPILNDARDYRYRAPDLPRGRLFDFIELCPQLLQLLCPAIRACPRLDELHLLDGSRPGVQMALLLSFRVPVRQATEDVERLDGPPLPILNDDGQLFRQMISLLDK